MFEKFIDVLTLLIAALQENTEAHNRTGNRAGGTAVTTHVAAADATLTVVGDAPATAAVAAPAPPRKKKETAAAPPPPKAAEPAAAPDFGAEEAKPATLTKEEANEVLVAEWKRLGSNAEATSKITGLFAEYGVAGLVGLKPELYSDFVARAQAL